MKNKPYFFIMSLLLNAVCSVPYFAYGNTIDDYSLHPRAPNNSRVEKARQIFERVRDVANKHPKFPNPQLVVLKSLKNGSKQWAVALEDGHILLWTRAIDASYQAKSQNEEIEAEARLAFILGHELGHLASDDYGFLKRSPKNVTQKRRKRELAADKKGYAYAALSGYRVNFLLKKTSNNNYFLEQWLKRPREIYPPVEISVSAFQNYLHKLEYKLSLFEFGVRLSHFERCDDGVYFLQAFQKVFPAREVFNNLGFCYLQLARQEMDSEPANFYWMPQILDAETLAARIVMGEEPVKTLKQAARRLSNETKDLLEKAEEFIKQAIEADLDYFPARLNLAITYLYLGQPYNARFLIDQAYRLAPDNLEIQGLRTIIFYEQSGNGLDIWSSAIEPLKKRAAKLNAPPSLLYNLARLLDIRASRTFSDDAKRYWNRLARMADTLPKPIRAFVCRQPNTVCDTKLIQHQPPPWQKNWPIPFKWQKISEQEAVMNRLSDWEEPIPIDLSEKLRGHIYQRPNGGVEVLELEEFMQMQVLKGDNLGTVHKLSNYCGQPLRQRTLANGELWSCGNWAALAFDGKVQEVWRILR